MPELEESISIALDANRGQEISVVGGSRGVWRIEYRAGSRKLKPGGGIRIFRETHKFWLGMVKQTTDPGDEDYCAAGSDGPPVELTDVPLFYKRLYIARLVVGEPGLREGERLWFTCGTAAFPATVPPFSQRRCVFWVDVDYEGDGSYQRLPHPLVVSVVPGPAVKATVVAPSVVAPDEAFSLKVRFEDKNSNPHAPHAARASFTCEAADATLPGEYEFTDADEGWRVFEGCRLPAPGVYRIGFAAEGIPAVLSNPILCLARPAARVWWGDMHNHTEWCDGTDTVEYVYRFGRDHAFLDVCASSEHIGVEAPEWPIGAVDKPALPAAPMWAEQQKQTRRYYQPGRFVTFLGYEFTPHGGERENPANADHCVWFLDDRHELVIDEDIEALGRKLAPIEGFMAAHVGGRYTRWDYQVPPEAMPVVEIASMHEHSEWFVQQALQKGLKVGIVGMSDGHMGRPGYDLWARHGRAGLHKRTFSPQSAITAFLTPTLDREGVWEAMRSRRVYATTGARILLEFSCEGASMGEVVTAAARPSFRIAVHGTAPIDRVQVIRGDRLAHTVDYAPAVTGGEPVWDVTLEWTDPEPVAGETYYYLRVTQSDDHFAWSSPIWVSVADGIQAEEDDLPPWNEDVWPPAKKEPEEYLPRIKAHLEQRRCGDRFVELEQIGVFEETRGRYVLVRGRDAERGGRTMHLHYYLDFEDERLYVSAGWADYGPISNQ